MECRLQALRGESNLHEVELKGSTDRIQELEETNGKLDGRIQELEGLEETNQLLQHEIERHERKIEELVRETEAVHAAEIN